jgi:hypothetical protein
MVDNVDTVIGFSGKKSALSSQNIKPVMDALTQEAIIESTTNYNKLVNNMLDICGNICIKNFNISQLNQTEKNCTENCQKKFYASYSKGERLLNLILENANKTDLFSDATDVSIINNSLNK